MLDLQGAQARPDPSGGAGQRVGAVQSRGSMCLVAHRLGARALGAPGGRLRAPRTGVLDLEAARSYLPILSASNLCTQLYVLHAANSA